MFYEFKVAVLKSYKFCVRVIIFISVIYYTYNLFNKRNLLKISTFLCRSTILNIFIAFLI